MTRSAISTETMRINFKHFFSVRLTLAIFLFVLYLITGSGTFHIIDEVSLYSVTENLARRGAWNTDQIAWSQWVNSPAEVLGAWGHDGHVYSKKGPAPILAFLPLRTIASFIPGVGLLQMTFLSNALITLLTALFLWAIVRRLGYDEGLGAAAALIFGAGTLAWPYATHLFGEPLSALSLTIALWALIAFRQEEKSRYLVMLGLGLGMAVASNAAYALTVLLFIGVWLVSVHQQGRRLLCWRHLVALLAPLSLFALLLFWYNIVRFGGVFTTGYHFHSGEGFNGPWLSGLYGLLFSPYRGIFYHQPLTLLALIGFPLFWRRHRLEALLTASASLLLLFVFAKWWIWWGGFAWGPRFLVPLAPYLVLWILPLLQQGRRWLVWTLVGLSSGVQALAVSANYVLWEIELRNLYPTDWRDPLRYGAPALTNLFHSPVFGQIRLLARRQWHDVLDFAWFQANGVHVWTPVVGVGLLAAAAGGLVAFWRRKQGGWRLPLVLLVALLPFTYATLRVYAQDERYGVPDRGYAAILTEVARTEQEGDALVTVAPYHYHIPMNRYNGKLPILGFALEQPLHTQTEFLLEQTLAQGGGIYLVTAGLPPAAPNNGVELWLNEHAYLADDRWFDDFRLLRYGTVPADQPLRSGQDWGDPAILTLRQASASALTLPPASFLNLALLWLGHETSLNLHLFIQLQTPDQAPVAQYDRGWTLDSESSPQPKSLLAALWIPPDVPVGAYQLIIGWYDPASGQRLPVAGKDFAVLGEIHVRPH